MRHPVSGRTPSLQHPLCCKRSFLVPSRHSSPCCALALPRREQSPYWSNYRMSRGRQGRAPAQATKAKESKIIFSQHLFTEVTVIPTGDDTASVRISVSLAQPPLLTTGRAVLDLPQHRCPYLCSGSPGPRSESLDWKHLQDRGCDLCFQHCAWSPARHRHQTRGWPMWRSRLSCHWKHIPNGGANPSLGSSTSNPDSC